MADPETVTDALLPGAEFQDPQFTTVPSVSVWLAPQQFDAPPRTAVKLEESPTDNRVPPLDTAWLAAHSFVEATPIGTAPPLIV